MSELKQEGGRKRVLSGMRPTGKLHLGNYMGALYNWVKLQEEYECYFFIADWHALTTDYADPSRLLTNIFEIAVDFLAAGLNPARSTIFVQSHVPQHAELNLLFGMFTPLSWLERVPTYKDQQDQLREKDLATYGFLGYPLLQSADILLYQPDFVPVGQDQVAHVELTREVARKFNQLYSPRCLIIGEKGTASEELDPGQLILPEPEVLLTPSPKLLGIDGRKMSKSYGNSILLSEAPGNVEEKMSRMSNGGQRNPQTEPGEPNICPVGEMHALFSDQRVNDYIREGCRSASILCIECKVMAANGINIKLHPIRERREELERDPAQVWDVLDEGARRAGKRAEFTMDRIREATGLSRRRRPVPDERQVYLSGFDYSAPHDLTVHSEWWSIPEHEVRGRNLREYWRTIIVPGEIVLTPDSDRVYVTRRGKRVYAPTARESQAGRWYFEARVKSYEILVLLCWANDFFLHDFVIPQSAFVAPWSSLKKTFKKEKMPFWVVKSETKYFLELPGFEPIDITSYRGQYRPMS
jgi:tryptophanyl-tRNA synthetase